MPEEHVVYTNCWFCFDIQNNFGTQLVFQMLRASEKDLPVRNLLSKKWNYPVKQQAHAKSLAV